MRREAGLQRFQPPTSATHPVRQSRAVDLDAVPGEDLALPIKRKVIAVLGDQDMSEKTGTGEALGDRKSTGLNSSHVATSYAVFCLTKKTEGHQHGHTQDE